MRIAYVCADAGVPVFGRKGSSQHVRAVIRALLNRDIEVELFAARVEGNAPPGLDIEVHPLPITREREDRDDQRRLVETANTHLRESIRRYGPFDAVYERYSLWSHAAMEHARSAGIPGLLEVNSPLIEEHAAHRGLKHRPGAEQVASRAFGAAKVLLAVSAQVAQHLRASPAVSARVHVVPNGVDPERFRECWPASKRRAARPFTVGFLGSLRPWHGLDLLVEAFSLLRRRDPAARLLVIGDGPERANVVASLERHGLGGAADFTGAVDSAVVPLLLGQMDVGVAPYPQSGDFYFSPLKVFEYMAAGVPVVASRVGQLADLVDEGENGLLCAAGDPVDLACTLDQLRRDVALRSRLGRSGREVALRNHTWAARIRTILEIAQLNAGGSSAVQAAASP